MLAILTGFAAGALHVLTGPDHLAAVAPLAADVRQKPWRQGVRWGLGHSGGVALVAMVLLSVRGLFHIETFSSWAEVAVGVVLVGIGLWTFRRALSRRLHVHEHSHGSDHHVHFHVHSPDSAHASRLKTSHHHRHTALGIGTLHGLAGSSHFFAVLPALALPHAIDSLFYLAFYAVGTIVAMAGFAQIVGQFFQGLMRSGLPVYRWALGSVAVLTTATDIVSMGMLLGLATVLVK